MIGRVGAEAKLSSGGSPYHFWSEGWVNLFPLKFFPVDLSKQRMLANVSSHAQPLLRFSHKKLQGGREGMVHFCDEEAGSDQVGVHYLGCGQLAFVLTLVAVEL